MVDQDPELRDLMRRARAGLSPTETDFAAAHLRLKSEFWNATGASQRAATQSASVERTRRWVQGGLVGLVAGCALGFFLGGRLTVDGDWRAAPSAPPSSNVVQGLPANIGAPVSPGAAPPRSAEGGSGRRWAARHWRRSPSAETWAKAPASPAISPAWRTGRPPQTGYQAWAGRCTRRSSRQAPWQSIRAEFFVESS